MSRNSDLNYHKGVTLSEPTVCLSTVTVLFPPNEHCFTAFPLCGNSFLQRRRARALSPATGLVARIQLCHSMTSGAETLLQASAG